jgi:hypothetical protein
LFPAFDSGKDAAWIGGPDEWFWIGVVLRDEAIDGGFKVVDGSEDAAHQAPAREFGEEPSTALSQDAEVGVKWKVQRGWQASHARTLGCLWVA